MKAETPKSPLTFSVSVATSQQGAVLIAVLLFLILITLVGVMAVRQSSTNLKLATSDQINALLLQSADNANQNIEQSINGDPDAQIYQDMTGAAGPLGHFIFSSNNWGNEYVFCFRPRGVFFNIFKSTITVPDGGTMTNTGYCDPDQANDYISDRNASMTQVNVSLTPPTASDEAFGNYVSGQDSAGQSSITYNFDIYSTSVLPSYGDTELDGDNCFAKTSQIDDITNATDSIGGCMKQAGVPSTVLYQQADVANESLKTMCVNYGTGGGLLCTLPAG